MFEDLDQEAFKERLDGLWQEVRQRCETKKALGKECTAWFETVGEAVKREQAAKAELEASASQHNETVADLKAKIDEYFKMVIEFSQMVPLSVRDSGSMSTFGNTSDNPAQESANGAICAVSQTSRQLQEYRKALEEENAKFSQEQSDLLAKFSRALSKSISLKVQAKKANKKNREAQQAVDAKLSEYQQARDAYNRRFLQPPAK